MEVSVKCDSMNVQRLLTYGGKCQVW